MLQDIYNQTPAIILAHEHVGKVLGKTIHGILMHSKLFNVISLIDRNTAGMDTSKICQGVSKKIPIFATLKEALNLNPRVAILSREPNEEDIEDILTMIRHKIDILNPTFEFLNENALLKNEAANHNVRLTDLRNYDYVKRWADGSILDIKSKVVFVSGTDCGLGKRTAAYELTEEAKKRGIKAAFAATGQTGIMLGCEDGIIFDAVPTNYSAGAVEKLICDLDKKGYDLIFLEGQASLMHFGGSTSITLLHAGNPHAILLVHDPEREYHAEFGKSPIMKMCSLTREIEIIENLYLPGGNHFKVVGIPTIGKERIKKIKEISDLPTADVRQTGGPAILLDAVLNHLKKHYKWAPVPNSA